MRPPTLQYFYLEKPMTLLILITFISVVMWIGKGDYYTKGEPREASVAVSMLEKNQWILPETYADEIAYKPPLTHWLMAVFSLPRGEVTPFSSRLPSALAFVGLIVTTFLFFGKNLKFQDSFLAALVLLTSFELHRAAMTSRVDMLLTFLIVLALTRLFRWEERKKLEGFPVWIVIIQGLAALTKGPVGIVLPLLVFGIYLLFLKYNIWKIAGKLIPVALASLVLPLIWYFLAYRVGGNEFSDIVWAENFGRFLGSENLNIHYDLGHKEAWWYNFLTLAAGFIPWTILLFISLFGLNYSKKIPGIRSLWNSFIRQDKIKLFSAIAAIVIIVFYCIPVSKRSVYLMPAYPFISIFIAQYVLYLRENKTKLSAVFDVFINIIACIVGLFVLLMVIFPVIDPVLLVSYFVKKQRVLDEIACTWQSFQGFSLMHVLLLLVLLYSLFVFFKHFKRKNYLKVLYSTIGVYLALNLVLDGIFLPAYKDGISVKPYAGSLEGKYRLKENNLFVMNDLLKYGGNMYGLNFYLHNKFRNFEKEQPSEGFFLVGRNTFEKVSQHYGDKYTFTLLEEYNNKTRDGERVILLFDIRRKKNIIED
ncbi:MAG: glycosyltransferase family 39 protein [Dysgonamonadaceae bacterium]|jgi:4-amino-4-deoxy-L-arabinose transferase-like glycosyltransferase|nr:glycosyltransferase family 39 protein [Dysgonamonadaceae bacterium]